MWNHCEQIYTVTVKGRWSSGSKKKWWFFSFNGKWYLNIFFNLVIISSKSAFHDLAKADIFNNKNLAVWKRQIDALLHFNGLTYVIESDPISKPADDAPKEDHDVYEQ